MSEKDIRLIKQIFKKIKNGTFKIKNIIQEFGADIKKKLAEFIMKKTIGTALKPIAIKVAAFTILGCLILGVIALAFSSLLEFITAFLAGIEKAKMNWNFLWGGRSSRVNEEMISKVREELKKKNIDFKEKGYIGEDVIYDIENGDETEEYKKIKTDYFTTTFAGQTLVMTPEEKNIIEGSPSDTQGKVKQLITYIDTIEKELQSKGYEESSRLYNTTTKQYYISTDGADNTKYDSMCNYMMQIKDLCSKVIIKNYLYAQEYCVTNENCWTFDPEDQGGIEVKTDASFELDDTGGIFQNLFKLVTGSYSVYSPGLNDDGEILDNANSKTASPRFYVKINSVKDTSIDPEITNEVVNIAMLWQYPLAFHINTISPDVGVRVAKLAKTHHKVRITLYGSGIDVVDSNGKIQTLEKFLQNTFNGESEAFKKNLYDEYGSLMCRPMVTEMSTWHTKKTATYTFQNRDPADVVTSNLGIVVYSKENSAKQFFTSTSDPAYDTYKQGQLKKYLQDQIKTGIEEHTNSEKYKYTQAQISNYCGNDPNKVKEYARKEIKTKIAAEHGKYYAITSESKIYNDIKDIVSGYSDGWDLAIKFMNISITDFEINVATDSIFTTDMVNKILKVTKNEDGTIKKVDIDEGKFEDAMHQTLIKLFDLNLRDKMIEAMSKDTTLKNNYATARITVTTYTMSENKDLVATENNSHNTDGIADMDAILKSLPTYTNGKVSNESQLKSYYTANTYSNETTKSAGPNGKTYLNIKTNANAILDSVIDIYNLNETTMEVMETADNAIGTSDANIGIDTFKEITDSTSIDTRVTNNLMITDLIHYFGTDLGVIDTAKYTAVATFTNFSYYGTLWVLDRYGDDLVEVNGNVATIKATDGESVKAPVSGKAYYIKNAENNYTVVIDQYGVDENEDSKFIGRKTIKGLKSVSAIIKEGSTNAGDILAGDVIGVAGGNITYESLDSAMQAQSPADELAVSEGAGVQNIEGRIYYNQKSEPWGPMQYSKIGDSSQTYGSSACGPTSYAIVISNLIQNSSVTPLVLGEYSLKEGYRTDNNGTSAELFTDTGLHDTYGIQLVSDGPATDKAILDAVNNGCYVIFNINYYYSDGKSGGHYVCVGPSSTNEICALDPYPYYAGRMIDLNGSQTLKEFKSKRSVIQLKSYWAFKKK